MELGEMVNGKITARGVAVLPCEGEGTKLLKCKAGQLRADGRKGRFLLEITNPEAASAETMQTLREGSAQQRQRVLERSARPDQAARTRLAGGSEARAGAPSASGLFVTEPGGRAL